MTKKWKITLLTVLLALCIVSLIFYPKYQKFIPELSVKIESLNAEQIAEIRQKRPITEIQVFKAKRELHLLHYNQIIRSYPMRLGFTPIGHKKEEGDGKTPEGSYVIDWRNSKSLFYKSLHISYPNAEDLAQAKARGVSAGGDIMIHGSANNQTAKLPNMMNYLPKSDWTWGCVAVRNIDMDEIWHLVDNGTKINLYP